jgi:hypothetical protein
MTKKTTDVDNPSKLKIDKEKHARTHNDDENDDNNGCNGDLSPKDAPTALITETCPRLEHPALDAAQTTTTTAATYMAQPTTTTATHASYVGTVGVRANAHKVGTARRSDTAATHAWSTT